MLPIGEFRQPRSGPLMLLFANSLDGVGGCLVSGLQPPRRDGVVSCLAERSSTRCSALMSAISKIFRWRTGVPARQDSSTRVLPKFPLPTTNHVAADASAAQPSAAPLAVRTLLSAISKKTSVEDGRPRPSRFEHWRASKFPSRHFKPPRDGGLVRPDERVCEVRDLERRAKRPQAT